MQPGVPAPSRSPLARTLRWCAIAIGVLLLGAYGAYCAMMYRVQEDIIFAAEYRGRRDGAGKPPEAEQLWLEAREADSSQSPSKTEAWYFTGKDRSASNPGPLVVLFHGNGDIIDNYTELARLYASLGCGVLLPEYRGYGRASGQPAEVGIVADSARFITDTLARPEVDRNRVVLHGRSLGGGVATAVAARLRDTAKIQPAVLVLDSTFTSIAAMSGRYLVPSFLVKHPFRTDRELPRLSAAVIITHGTADRVIPYSHALALKKIRPDATLVTLDCDHLDFPGKSGAYERSLRAFLADKRIIDAAP
jgi:fermentation-respiration switch protein FrsA (DUF1100 family)